MLKEKLHIVYPVAMPERIWNLRSLQICIPTMHLTVQFLINSQNEQTFRIANDVAVTYMHSKYLVLPILRDHPYITSAKGLGGWGQKNGNFC